MAFLGSVKRECDIRNRKNRNVREKSSSLNVDNFWRSAVGQNFLISGGNESQRSQILSSAICEYRQKNHGPIIILNGSRDFETNLISKASQGRTGKLIVSSKQYKNYDLFYGMPDDIIRNMFEIAAQKRTVSEMSSFGDYSEAFFKVLKCKYTPSFHSMFAMARTEDRDIAAFGQANRVNSTYVSYIKKGVSGSSFRRVLTDFGRAFLNIHAAQTTGFNISQVDNSDKTYLIWANSEAQELFNMELARELVYLKDTKGIDYLLIINDMTLTREDPLFSVIAKAKQKNLCGFCSANAVEGVFDEATQKVITGNVSSLVIVNSGIEDHGDQEFLLGKYGNYNHFEPIKGAGAKPGWTQIPGTAAPHMGMIQYEKQRVTVDDMQKYVIAVRGNLGDTVSLYKGIADNYGGN